MRQFFSTWEFSSLEYVNFIEGGGGWWLSSLIWYMCKLDCKKFSYEGIPNLLVQDYIYKLNCKKFPKWRQSLYTGIRRKQILETSFVWSWAIGVRAEILLAIYLYAQEDFG